MAHSAKTAPPVSGNAHQHTCQTQWQRLWGETRTRILLLYALLMLVVTGASIPIFLNLFFTQINQRVQEDLEKDMQAFLQDYRAWERQPNQTMSDLENLVWDAMRELRPEDDNFLIFFLDNQFYEATSLSLPQAIAPDSELAQQWGRLTESTRGSQTGRQPRDTILFMTEPLRLNGEVRGTVVAAHTSAGELDEALEGAALFGQVAAGVLLISFMGAWFLTGQLLSPVKKLAIVARSVSESDLTQRLPLQGSGELAALSSTFNNMLDRLQNAFTSQRNFINDAGHELRTPITIIQGHLELMGSDPQEQQETLELVMDELNRMNRMVNDLLLLSKAERPDFLQLETIDMQSFTEALLIKVQSLGDRRWELKIWGEGRMVGDRQRLTGAVVNLAQNAVQHTNIDDLIEIGSSITRSQVRFWVHDTGEGIPEGDQQRIFERFGRAANQFRKSDGSGLGLAIVRAIAEAHGGQVELESKPGIGSKFTLVLPIEPPREHSATLAIQSGHAS